MNAKTGEEIAFVTLGPGGSSGGGGITVNRRGEIYFSMALGMVDGYRISAWGKVVDLSLGKEGTITERDGEILPSSYSLFQNYPNPFAAEKRGTFANPETAIRFEIPQADHVVLTIFNTLGQEIRTLANGDYQSGHHIVRWDGRDSQGDEVPNGMYLYQLQTGQFSRVKKMTLLR